MDPSSELLAKGKVNKYTNEWKIEIVLKKTKELVL